jgi:FKBP12-rapamycin complex-associated protein
MGFKVIKFLQRIKGCQRNVEVWQRILKVRSLVVSPKDDLEIWIKFANMCRKGGRMGLSFKTLSALLNISTDDFKTLVLISLKKDIKNNSPHVVYACLKHLWATGDRSESYTQMKNFTQDLVEGLGVHSPDDIMAKVESQNSERARSLTRLLARCHLRIGEWKSSLLDDSEEKRILPDTLRSYYAATQYDKNWYKAWHSWAYANFEIVSYHEKIDEIVPTNILITHVVPSVHGTISFIIGFFRSIALSTGNSLQDTLRLLTLWFKYGYQQDVNIAISEGFSTVSIDTWLDVIPQVTHSSE